MKKIYPLLLISLFVCLTGCRGWQSKKSPIHLNPNLDFQASIKEQEFPQLPPHNIVPWGNEASLSNDNERAAYSPHQSDPFYTGKLSNQNWVKRVPIAVTYQALERGKERYNIFCSSCHGLDGSGNGIVMKYGWFNPQPYWSEHIVSYADGELFNIITNGIRTMPGYAQQIPENDRWTIVLYIRALQASHNVSFESVPNELKSQLQ